MEHFLQCCGLKNVAEGVKNEEIKRKTITIEQKKQLKCLQHGGAQMKIFLESKNTSYLNDTEQSQIEE